MYEGLIVNEEKQHINDSRKLLGMKELNSMYVTEWKSMLISFLSTYSSSH